MRFRPILAMTVILMALGMYVYLSSRPEQAPPAAPRLPMWSVETDDLKRVSISLPSVGKSLAWVKHEDHNWYFDIPEGSPVNTKRWGGGVPLLLSAPEAERRIAEHATGAQLVAYGLNVPSITMSLTLVTGRTIQIEVGDRTPDGQAYYIRLAEAREVYAVHHTWYHVLERLVLEPPYPESE